LETFHPTDTDMSEESADLQSSYDRVADRYAEEYFSELERKPFDREVLDKFANEVRGKGAVCEIGCGPAQVARYLKDRGVDIHGVDLSEEMVRSASRLNPDITFAQGNMLELKIADNSLAGIVSFYAIIHLKRDEIGRALAEMNRVLEPGGRLLISFHDGDGELHRDEWYGQAVSIDVTLLREDEVTSYLEKAGLNLDSIVDRPPYEFEYPTRRVYVQASKT
jgi:ubiquinone/menaquinone biosynthesis C-methylase UbiE